MKKVVNEKLYDLIPSQQTMYVMIKYSVHKQVIQVPTSFTVNKRLDFDLLKKALNIEIERNDCMRLRFVKLKEGVKQYFLPEFKIDEVEIKTFRSKQEQDDFFAADAQKPVKFFKDEVFRIIFYNSVDGSSGIYLNVCHMNMDASAVAVFYLDLLAVYKSLQEGTPLPEPLFSYEEYIQKDLKYLENKELFEKDDAFYREYFKKEEPPFYAGIHGHDLLDKARKKKKDPNLRVPAAYNPIKDKADLLHRHVGPEEAQKIFDYCRQTLTSPETLILLGYRTHASAINYRTDDVFQTVLCSRRATYKEKRSGGCITQPLQFRTVIPETATFRESLDKYSHLRNQLYRHMNYPYLKARDLTREIYGFKMIEAPGCMMYTWLPMPTRLGDGLEVEFRGYNLGRYVFPVYVFSFPNMKDGGIDFFYMYKIQMITPEQIHALHDNGLKVILKGIENPDSTIGQLLDSIS